MMALIHEITQFLPEPRLTLVNFSDHSVMLSMDKMLEIPTWNQDVKTSGQRQ